MNAVKHVEACADVPSARLLLRHYAKHCAHMSLSNDELEQLRERAWLPARSWQHHLLTPHDTSTAASSRGGGGGGGGGAEPEPEGEAEGAEGVALVNLNSGGVVLACDAELAWTQCRVLERSADSLPLKHRTQLRVAHPVPPATVIAHLRCLVERLRALGAGLTQGQAERYRRVLQRCLSLLGKACKKGATATCAMIEQGLSPVPFVLFHFTAGVTVEWLPARALCYDLEEDLGPRTRAVPEHLVPHRALLCKLGAPSATAALGNDAPAVEVQRGAAMPGVAVAAFIVAQFDRRELSDVHFECAGGEVVYAHRLVLASCGSEYFRALFSFAPGEHAEWPLRVPLQWAAAAGVRLVLAQFYTGEMERAHKALSLSGRTCERLYTGEGADEASVELVCCMLRLADMWGVSFARQWCERWLASSNVFDIWNVCAVLSHAHGCHAPQLLRVCVYQIRKLFAVVSKTAEWAELEPELQNIVTGST